MKPWVLAVIAFLLALIYPIAILLTLDDPGEAGRWIKNDLSFNFFLPLIFPLAVGCLFYSYNPSYVHKLPSPLPVITYVILGVFIFLTGILVYQDKIAEDRNVAPFELKAHSAAIKQESCFRDRDDKEDPDRRNAYQDRCGEKDFSKLPESYKTLTKGYSSFADLVKRGNFIAYWSVLLNFMGGIFSVFLFWYLLVLVEYRMTGGKIEELTIDGSFLAALLLYTWFPLRLYSEWYHNFSDMNLISYQTFWIFLVLAFGGFAIYMFLRGKRNMIYIFSTFHGVVIALLGILGHFNPDSLKAIASVLENMSFTAIFAAELVLFVVILTALISIINPQPTSGTGAKK